MTQREKILALAVGSLVGVIGFVYLASNIATAFSDRTREAANRQSEIIKQERTIMFGNEAKRELEELVAKSLPSNRLGARGVYRAWLLELADAKIKLEGVDVNPQMGKPQGDLYYQHPFLVSGNGTLEQLVEFLYEFYQADYLHRIGYVSAQPIPGESLLKLSIRVEALALEAAPAARELNNDPVSKLTRGDLEDYVEMIAHRNPFAPANKAPSFARLRRQNGNTNRSLNFTVKAEDPDKHSISYEFVGDVPEGMSIDAKTGDVRWTPKEKGSFEIKVKATDAGMPALTAETLVNIAITDAAPPAAKPQFDPATQAEVTGITETGSEPELWVSVHTEGRVLILREGDKLSVGTVTGVVAEINYPEATIKTDDGEEIKVSLGMHLVESTGAGG